MATPLAPLKIHVVYLNSTILYTLPYIRVKNFSIFAKNWNRCNFCLFLPKFGCHGNSIGSLKITDSIFNFADPENLTIRVKKSSFFLRRTELGRFFAYFCPNLVAMATPLAPLKLQIAYLILPTPKKLIIRVKKSSIFMQNWNRCIFLLIFAQIWLPWQLPWHPWNFR